MPQMEIPELHDFLAQEFPQVADEVRIEALTDDSITVRLKVSDRHLRPGGTLGGPAMFMLADVAAYCAILSRIGWRPLAVTTNAGIDFLRKPAPGRDLLCEATILKFGRVLVVVEARIFSEGTAGPVARANLTYSIPPSDRPSEVIIYLNA
ncbi:PaaI family thioesterase [Rubellimicrobium mesophilum]|nr:PaaI family thioesterase [Rubellimicrobium mesophilum]